MGFRRSPAPLHPQVKLFFNYLLMLYAPSFAFFATPCTFQMNVPLLLSYSLNRLHPASAGIINLKLWRTLIHDTSASSDSHTKNADSTKECLLLITQGRDGTIHMWEVDNELSIVEESVPVRSFVRDTFSFCRFSFLAADGDLNTNATTSSASAGGGLQTPEEFVEAVFADGATRNIQNDVEMKEESFLKRTASVVLQNAITAIHTCSTSTSSFSSVEQQEIRKDICSKEAALIAIPSYSEKVVEVCCAACCAPLAMFLQKEKDGAVLPEESKWGMCMATKLFLGPKEVNNDILLAVGYESGYVVLWSVTAAVQASAAAAAEVGVSLSTYSPPKPLAYAKLHSEPIMALDIDTDGYSGVSGSAEDALTTFSINYTTGDPAATSTTITPTATISLKKQGVGDVALRQDGKILASAGWDGKIRVYKKSSGKALAVFRYHSASASAVEFSPRKFLIASGARDGTVALWDVYSAHDT
jgi:WD40 repeat protein